METLEGDNLQRVAERLADVLDELLHGDGRILHEFLIKQTALFVESLELAGQYFLQQSLGLPLGDKLSLGNLLLLGNEGGIQRGGT